MHAATYTTFGPAADVITLSELPDQAPEAGEVRIKIAFSGVNPSDVKARAGSRPGVTKPPFPVICPHSDGSGIITSVGAGVDTARIGEQVWIWNGQWQRPFGTAATHINLPAIQAVPLPKDVPLEAGASLGIPGLTAAHVVFGGGDVRGQTILIHGGNGSVGHLAVQLAKWGGARVITTSSPSGFARAQAAGADIALDYKSEKLAQDIAKAADGAPIDRIVDVEFGENITVNADVIAPSGTLAVYGSAKNMTPELPFGSLLFKAVKIDIALIYILPPEERQRAIKKLHAALSAAALSCPVAQTYRLADIPRAHEAVESGQRQGAILVAPDK
ncbi:MAG: NADPH:quinone reductase [Roseobacter sp.]